MAELKQYNDIQCPSIDQMVRCQPVSIRIPGFSKSRGEETPMRRMTLVGKIGRFGWVSEPEILIESYDGLDALGVERWIPAGSATFIEKHLFMELQVSKLALQATSDAYETTAKAYQDSMRQCAELKRESHESQEPANNITREQLQVWKDELIELVDHATTVDVYDSALQPIIDKLEAM